MVQNLYSQNILIYIYAGLCGLGLLVRFILELIHIRLISESDNLGATKNKTLKHMKMKFETCYKLKIGVNNVDTFVDKNILRYRFCGVLLSTWENISGQVLLLTFLIVPVSTVFGVLFDCGQDEIINAGAVGILTGSIIILVDRIVNLSAKKRIIRLNLMDYLENFCKVRLEQEAFHPELLEQYRKEYFQTTEVKQVSAAAALTKDDSKSEINRRREARLRKEEEKRAMQLRREEEQKRIEKARKDEENKKQEERKRLAAKRREEELLKLEEEREALERRRAEMKKKADEKQQMNGKKPLRTEEITKSIRKAEEEFAAAKKTEDIKQILEIEEEIAAEMEAAVKGNAETETKPLTEEKAKPKVISPQEEKLIEDILKEFFA